MQRQVAAGDKAVAAVLSRDDDCHILVRRPDPQARRGVRLISRAGPVVGFDIEKRVPLAPACVQRGRAGCEQYSRGWIELYEEGIGGPDQSLWAWAACSVEKLEADVTVDPAWRARSVPQLEGIENVAGCRIVAIEGNFELRRVTASRSRWYRKPRITCRCRCGGLARCRLGSRGRRRGSTRRWIRRCHSGTCR